MKMADNEIEHPGTYCMRYGISTTWLLSLLHASKDECVHSVPDISDYCPTVQI